MRLPSSSLASTPASKRMQILKAGVLYFAVVFGAGFILRPIRILWVAPRLGTRMAELLEMSIMLLIAIVAARLFLNWQYRSHCRAAWGLLRVVISSNSRLLFFQMLNDRAQTGSDCFFDLVKYQDLQDVALILLHLAPPTRFEI